MTQAREASSTAGSSCQPSGPRPETSPRREPGASVRRKGSHHPFAELEGSLSNGHAASGLAAGGLAPGATTGQPPCRSLGPLAGASAPGRSFPGALGPGPSSPGSPWGATLESQGVEILRLGRDSRGRGELILRVRCGDEVLNARLAEDGAGGVRVSLGGTVGESRMQRLTEALASQGHNAQADLKGDEPGGNPHRHRRQRFTGEPELPDSDEEQAPRARRPGSITGWAPAGPDPHSLVLPNQRLAPGPFEALRDDIPAGRGKNHRRRVAKSGYVI